MASLKRKAGADLAAAGDPKRANQQQSSLMTFFGGGAGNGLAKKTFSSSPPSGATAELKFDKAKWVAKLTKEQQQLLQLEIGTLDDSWLAVLKEELVTPSFLELKRFLSREHAAGKKIFPAPEDVYSWSRYTPFNKVKVVIVGQDPYHNVGQAHGLAFSVKPPIPPPPSLKNMYIALKKDYPGTFQPPPPHQGGLLTPWAERGVLMLNTCLTVRAHEANSHANHGWERFTQRVIDLVAQRRSRGVVFMAWGSPAAKRVVKIDSTRHLVLRSVHPSPLSAHRGFFDCGHFREANSWLVDRYGVDGEIDWSLMQGTTTIVRQKVKAAEEEATEEKEKIEEKAEATEEEEDGNGTEIEEEEVVAETKITKTDVIVKNATNCDNDKENVNVPETKDEKVASAIVETTAEVKTSVKS